MLRLVFAALLVLLAAPAGAVGPVLGPIPGTPGVPPSGALSFTVRKSGADIGEYAVRFAERDGELVVDIEANIRVRFAFVTVYRYTQRTREIWHDGTLQSLVSDVDDNGTPYKISAAQRDGRLVVDGHAEKLDLAPGTLPLSYWNYRLMRESRAFDLQWGSLADIEVAARGRRRGGAGTALQYEGFRDQARPAPGKTLARRRYVVRAGWKLDRHVLPLSRLRLRLRAAVNRAAPHCVSKS